MYVILLCNLENDWKDYCRLVFRLDGWFLKIITIGQLLLLSTVGNDVNNNIYHVTMTVVESENYDLWIDIEDGRTLIKRWNMS